MPNCCVSNCSNRSTAVSRNNGDISFHLFPKDPDLKNKWIVATGNKNWFPTKFSTICSAHFHSTDFRDTKKSRRLSEYAYPTIDVWRTTKDEISYEVTSIACAIDANNSDSDNNLSSQDSENLDKRTPPIVKRLIKQRSRLQAALKLEKMKVKKFRERNRRKDKKIEMLQNIIFDLKKKNNMTVDEVGNDESETFDC